MTGGPRSYTPEAIQFMQVKVLFFAQAKCKVLDVTSLFFFWPPVDRSASTTYDSPRGLPAGAVAYCAPGFGGCFKILEFRYSAYALIITRNI